eukprot:7330737-Prymnesium_polylepis.1
MSHIFGSTGRGARQGLLFWSVYNNASKYKAGTCIVALLLTNDQVGWSHHGRYNHQGSVSLVEDELYAKLYHTFGLWPPVPGVDNQCYCCARDESRASDRTCAHRLSSCASDVCG